MASQAARDVDVRADVAARALYIDLHHDEFWNPWRMEEQTAELDPAMQIMDEWERAELGSRRKTERQLGLPMARWEREWERSRVRREKERQANVTRSTRAVSKLGSRCLSTSAC